MTMLATLTRSALLASALVGTTAAYADALTATDPIQLGRLSRNATQQDWAGQEAYPGVINPSTPYHYRTYFYNVGLLPYVDITIDSVAATVFFSAYQTFYNPTNLAQGWLGDEGSSGNYNFSSVVPPVDSRFFDVVLGRNTTLVLVVNESTTNGGIAQPYDLHVYGNSSSGSYESIELFAVSAISRIPEPSTVLLLAFAPLALVAGRRARKQRSNDASIALAA